MSCVDEKKRLELLKLYKKFVLPRFPTYFEQVHEKRDKEQTWTEKAVVDDIFKPVCIRDPDNPNKINGTICCMIPAPKCFWDSWLAIYCLENPTTFPNVSRVAKILLEGITKIKLDTMGYQNFESYHEKYLLNTANGIGKNMLFEDPHGTIFLLSAEPVIETFCGDHTDPVEWLEREDTIKRMDILKKTIQSNIDEFLNKETKTIPSINSLFDL